MSLCQISKSKLYLSSILSREASDRLTNFGRHFGRTVHALCNVGALIEKGLARDTGVPTDEELAEPRVETPYSR